METGAPAFASTPIAAAIKPATCPAGTSSGMKYTITPATYSAIPPHCTGPGCSARKTIPSKAAATVEKLHSRLVVIAGSSDSVTKIAPWVSA